MVVNHLQELHESRVKARGLHRGLRSIHDELAEANMDRDVDRILEWGQYQRR